MSNRLFIILVTPFTVFFNLIFFDLELFFLKQVLDLVSKGGVKGIAHITGGGFTDNIPRVFPEGLGALIYKDSWEVPKVFKWLQEVINISLTYQKINKFA